jgi:nucleoside-diphosphate-sugar epimerase
VNILVIGGTRLLGLAVVKQLAAAGHSITVLSRQPKRCPGGVECIGADRIDGLNRLSGRTFDATIDFLGYDKAAPEQVFGKLDPGTYVLISSTWLVRLAPTVAADQAINLIDDAYAKVLPDITFSYLIGKMSAETSVLEMRKRNGKATVLRLPIFWGHQEHTGRLDFYRQRIADGAPVICVNGGSNYAQLVWVEDVAHAFIHWLHKASERPIWEALPDEGTKVRDIIKLIAAGMGKQPVLVDIPSERLLDELPDYLEIEPLWREVAINVTDNNIFKAADITPTPQASWLCNLAKQPVDTGVSELLERELSFLEHVLSD